MVVVVSSWELDSTFSNLTSFLGSRSIFPIFLNWTTFEEALITSVTGGKDGFCSLS